MAIEIFTGQVSFRREDAGDAGALELLLDVDRECVGMTVYDGGTKRGTIVLTDAEIDELRLVLAARGARR